MPKEKYSFAPEILAHSRVIGRHYDLYKNACFQTEVTAMRWDEESARWIVKTNRDDRMKARFVLTISGAPGTGTATPARSVTSSRTSICRSSKS